MKGTLVKTRFNESVAILSGIDSSLDSLINRELQQSSKHYQQGLDAGKISPFIPVLATPLYGARMIAVEIYDSFKAIKGK